MLQPPSVHPTFSQPPVWQRAREGARDGLYAALGLTIIALVVAGIATALEPNGLGELPIPLGAFIGLYFAGGAVCGATYGALRPFLGSLFGAILVGIVLCILGLGILTVAITIDVAATSPPKTDLAADIVAVAIMVLGVGALVGIMVGLILWARHRGGWLATVLPAAFVVGALALKSGLPFARPLSADSWWTLISRGAPILAALVIVLMAKRWFPNRPEPPT